ncbi:putative surface protein with fasciclin (FAS1) repeats [Kribbella orskensis]|uniref:Surface protein with fasciclin (FAS1) repeats n=1 Tax=Kribbella orskensis TaxID=2512216 RepID=A0ABY2BN97_9ACTN|nr:MULTISPECIES: fasciclin domain-containing protein [Kribbella]TCN40927.1 putative surface protein with fasciclin (FAS1) repeats [Kribbella sp. VKM Ac-2500]TCO24179.1 putative surface protein with fasciclin (FAS1) repeats [Kribbella orskensis]
MSHTIKRVALAASALSLLFVTAACGGSDDTSSGSPSTSTSSSVPAETPSASPSMDNAAGLVGPGCADYAKANPTGAGSVDGMAAAPVATAASGNPLLTTLVAAVSGKLNPKVDLVSTLNGGEFTVFAPVDSAFAKIPAATVNTLKTDDALLTKILTYHVVPGQLAPDAVVGSQTTVEKQAVTVTGSGDNLMVNNAKVICGGVKTANATVYLIDSVLMPPAA